MLKFINELLDNLVDTQNENLKIYILGFMQAFVEVAMKRSEKTTAMQIN